ncbi:Nif3-like dinuclear metal center hexameric protein [Dyadobacter sandarakinus]|uniref:Nif3-like dinuclear metal center hexameric protein n=1 Tax=Dyadobacter sandarakinus TaxID=2747268 RepID=A0ABX7I433_9BACT|nr:Nif3-like dinuclear metal center hexameric protein [Dyadobacter sandarakinus]QRR00550.1 Nif3-like dinuclear metal center hexameric protein [Dyadobacter sandarakinus]
MYPTEPSCHTDLSRRRFTAGLIRSALTISATGTSLFLPANSTNNKTYTVQDIIDLILKEGKLSKIPDTVDTIKAGSGSQQITSIVTTMFATAEVIRKAAELGANFIIAHEPTFYNHKDATDWVAANRIVSQKQELLKKHNMAIWRFHDYCHSIRPDVISYGVVRKTGWVPYYQNKPMMTIPSVSLGAMVAHLKQSLGIEHLRVIGNPEQLCTRVALLPGASGGQGHVRLSEAEQPDVLIVGEAPEWESPEYFRDAGLMGNKTALIVLGHAASEEPGMEYFVEWLQPKLQSIKITHVASGSPFTWY